MVRGLLGKLTSWGGRASGEANRSKLFFDEAPDAVYAVGDIHGCYDLWKRMEGRILEDGASFPGEKWIILLGDYVDRGPRSAEVLDSILQPPPPGFRRFCLAGNHEELMLCYLNDPDPRHFWLGLGGRETLRSYGIDDDTARRAPMPALLASHIPPEHIQFLRTAPSLIAVPGFVFAHAGLRPGVPLERQSDQDLLWLRPHESLPPPPSEFILVHGHTPVPAVDAQPGRINVDTGAFASGILSCVRIDREGRIVKLAVH